MRCERKYLTLLLGRWPLFSFFLFQFVERLSSNIRCNTQLRDVIICVCFILFLLLAFQYMKYAEPKDVVRVSFMFIFFAFYSLCKMRCLQNAGFNKKKIVFISLFTTFACGCCLNRFGLALFFVLRKNMRSFQIYLAFYFYSVPIIRAYLHHIHDAYQISSL